MQRSEIVLMVFTFLIGCVVGGYFYINGVWIMQQDVAPAAVAWRITGEEKGVCQRDNTCQLVYLDSNGTYRLAEGMSTIIAAEGELPARSRADLEVLVNGTDVASLQTGVDCTAVAAGERWYRYTIEDVDSVRSYETCDESVAAAPLNVYLRQVFTEATALQQGSTDDFVFEIFHSPEETWLSNFHLIEFVGLSNSN